MKRLFVSILALALVLTGCSGSKGTETPGNSTPPPANAPTPPAPAPEEKIEKLVLGFVPSQDAAAIAEKVKPMAQFLTQELGIPVEAFTGTNFVAVVEGMGSKTVDIGFLNPLSYVMAHADYDATVLLKSVRKGSDKYRSQLTARAADNIPVCDMAKDKTCKATFEALKGKKLAFVDAASTSGFLFPASFMMNAGVDYEKGKWFSDTTMAGQHDVAAKAVYNGAVDASWTFEDVRDNLEKEFPDVKEKLVAVAYTDWIPNDTISVRKGLPADLVGKIEAAFLKFASTDEGKAVLKDLYTIDGLVKGSDADYQVVKDMAKHMGIDIRAELTKPK